MVVIGCCGVSQAGRINVAWDRWALWFLVRVQAICSESLCSVMCASTGWWGGLEANGVGSGLLVTARTSLVTFLAPVFISVRVMCLVPLERWLPRSMSPSCGWFSRNPNILLLVRGQIVTWNPGELMKSLNRMSRGLIGRQRSPHGLYVSQKEGSLTILHSNFCWVWSTQRYVSLVSVGPLLVCSEI